MGVFVSYEMNKHGCLVNSLRVSSNTGRENAFPTRLSLRLLPAISPALAFDARGDLSR